MIPLDLLPLFALALFAIASCYMLLRSALQVIASAGDTLLGTLLWCISIQLAYFAVTAASLQLDILW